MRIHRIRLRNYRGVEDHEVVFPTTGVTVVEGDNEVGKSSLAEALDLLFDYHDSSTNKAVKATKPVHKDVGTEVEAEIEAGPYRFTYRKRFHREKATELRISAPRPENLTGREAHERAQQILAEAVDVPLWRALRLHQGIRPDQADLSEQTSLAAALDSASAGALAGDREATLIDLARAEFERFHTPTGRPKAEVLELARAEADAAERADGLRRDLTRLDDDIEHAASLEARIDELVTEIADQRSRADDYERKWRAVDNLLHEREAARARADAAEADQRGAVEDLSHRQALIEAAEASERRHHGLVVEHRRHEPALAAAATAVAAADERHHAAAEAAQQADATARRSHADLSLANDQLFLTQMTERLDRVTEAQHELDELDAALEANRVGAAELEAIEDAHLALAQARARLEGESAVIEVEALRELAVAVDGTVHDLDAGASLAAPIASATTVILGDVARITVRGGREAGQLAAAVENAERALAQACEAAGVADVAEARRAAAARRDAESAQRHLLDRRAADLRDLTPDAMARKVARLQTRLHAAGPHPVPDIDTARRLVEEAEAAVAAAQDRLREAEEEAGLRRAAFDQVRREAEASERDVELARRQAETALHDLNTARERVPDGVLAGRVELTTANAEEARRSRAEAEGAAEKARPDDLRLARDNAVKVLDKLIAEQRGAELDHRAVQSRLEVMGEQGLHDKLLAAEADLEHRRRERQATERRAAAAKRLYDTLTRCRAEARHAYVAPLRERIEDYGRIVFGEDFTVEVGDDLRILRRTLKGITVEFDQLSVGAREQLCVISRLACAAIVAVGDGAGEGVPVLLDDALGWSDSRRLERLGAVLSVAAKQGQVIVLTCLPERYRHVGDATVVRLG